MTSSDKRVDLVRVAQGKRVAEIRGRLPDGQELVLWIYRERDGTYNVEVLSPMNKRGREVAEAIRNKLGGRVQQVFCG